MSEVFNRLLCASANGVRAPIDADDVRELVDLYERAPGKHPTPGGAVPPERVPHRPRLGRAGGPTVRRALGQRHMGHVCGRVKPAPRDCPGFVPSKRNRPTEGRGSVYEGRRPDE